VTKHTDTSVNIAGGLESSDKTLVLFKSVINAFTQEIRQLIETIEGN